MIGWKSVINGARCVNIFYCYHWDLFYMCYNNLTTEPTSHRHAYSSVKSLLHRDVLLKERCLLNTEVLRTVVGTLFPDWVTICVPWISVPEGRLQIKCIWHRLSYSKKLFSKTFHVRILKALEIFWKLNFNIYIWCLKK